MYYFKKVFHLSLLIDLFKYISEIKNLLGGIFVSKE